jgi:hypothetical protein
MNMLFLQKKMKVKNCSQVFSHSLASAMYSAAKLSTQLVEESELYFESEDHRNSRFTFIF